MRAIGAMDLYSASSEVCNSSPFTTSAAVGNSAASRGICSKFKRHAQTNRHQANQDLENQDDVRTIAAAEFARRLTVKKGGL